MIPNRRIPAAVLWAAFVACGSPTDDGGGVPSGVVRGDLFRGTQPVAAATVELGTASAVTDAEGSFEFQGVVDGDYELQATYEVEDSGTVSRTIPVVVNGEGIDLGMLTLPDPVVLSVVAVTDRSVTVSWTESEDPGFREYKLYWGGSTAIDETTGQLAHVETSPTATQYFHGYASTGMVTPGMLVRPGGQYYYRLFVRDEYGLLGGSNIVEARTLEWPPSAYQSEYDLTQTDQFAGRATIRALTSDGTCVWVAYSEDTGETALVCRDLSTGTDGTELLLPASFGAIRGLTWDGTYLWVHHRSGSAHTARALDPTDGSVEREFLVTTDAFGLAWDGQYLVFGRRPGYVERIDPVTGGLVENIETPVRYDGLRSVTAHEGRIWGGGWFKNFVLVDSEGAVGVAYTDRYQGDSQSYPALIAFVGNDLAIVEDFRVFLFTPTPR